MKFTVTPMPIAIPDESGDAFMFECDVREPGTVRHLSFGLKKRAIAVRGLPDVEEILGAFVECEVEAPMRERRFLVVLNGSQPIGTNEGYALRYVRSATSNHSGRVAHLYELEVVS